MSPNSNRASQCARLLADLKRGPVTTAEARRMLGASSSPAARVLELRKDGHAIETQRHPTVTPDGHPVTIARYVLLPGGAA